MTTLSATYQYAFFLGSHPALSANEAIGVLEQQGFVPHIIDVEPEYLIVTIQSALPKDFLNRLGGTIRIARVIGQQTDPWLGDQIWSHLEISGNTKLSIGISSLRLPPREVRDVANELKARAKEYGVKMRFVVSHGKYAMLNAAQVLSNDLLIAPNQEIVLLQTKIGYLLLRSTHMQHIGAYELRDIKRPVRDARVGMLPPKLAQIMLNLAVSHRAQALQPATLSTPTLLDPFSGLGTILQEGWLIGYTMHGSDSNPRLVEAAKKNVQWVMQQFPSPLEMPRVRNHDVTEPFPPTWSQTYDAIVTEPFLGRPLHSPLTGKKAQEYLGKLADLYYTFFRHAHGVLKPHGIILIVFPAIRQQWRGDTFALLPPDFLDAIRKLGYIPKQLSRQELASLAEATPRHSLLYSRPDALIGRELTVWEKQ